MTAVVSYIERAPLSALAGVVRTVWIQRSGSGAYLQRHLPTGGVEIQVPIGGRPHLIGPLTGPLIEVIPPHTTIVGVRFHPAAAPGLRMVLDELVDQSLDLSELWGSSADRLVEALASEETPDRALMLLQAHLLMQSHNGFGVDPLVGEAVKARMPWRQVNVDAVATQLAVSASQLRRRCLHAVGVSPKVLQRILRFQGFLALAQAGATPRRSTRCGRNCRSCDRRGVRRPGTPQSRVSAPHRPHPPPPAPGRRSRPVRLRPRTLRLVPALPRDP